MAGGAQELRCSCRPVWPVDRPCSWPKATPWHRARHGLKREPNPRRAGDERLERPLRLHLLSPAVRVQPVRRSRKGAIKWTRLSCRTFAANAVRLQLHTLAYNLGNFLRTLATPEPIKDWSLTTLKDKLIKIGAKVVRHGRYVIFQMAEVAIARQMLQEILRLIAELRPQPPPALA